MRHLLLGLAALIIIACGGGGGGVPTPNPGTGFFETSNGSLSLRGRIAFVNAAGAAVPGPAEGAVVLVGTNTRATGTDSQGVFTVKGIPTGTSLRVRCYARGFMPVDFNVQAGATQTTLLRCQVDTVPGDNPQLVNRQFDVDNTGMVHFRGQAVLGSTLSMFFSPTESASQYAGANGDTVPVTSQNQFEVTLFDAALGNAIPTGSMYALVASAGGVAVSTYGTCQLNLTDYSRAGRLVNGNITGPNGQACVGAEVLGFEQTNTGNRGTANSVAEGRFGVSLASNPVENVSLLVQWTDPATNVTYVCLFRNLN